jgi:hypothetical protein
MECQERQSLGAPGHSPRVDREAGITRESVTHRLITNRYPSPELFTPITGLEKTEAGCDVSQHGKHLRISIKFMTVRRAHVGCSDNSPGKHAVIRSFERGEDWGWCSVEELFLEPAPRASS